MENASLRLLLMALHDPAHLQDFTRNVRAGMKADAVLLRFVNLKTWRFTLSVVCGNAPFTPEFFAAYDKDFAWRDPQTRVAELKKLPRGHIYFCHEHYGPEARVRDPYFDFIATHGVAWTAGYMAQLSDIESVAVCAVRVKGRPPFDEAARAHLTPVAYHLGAWAKAFWEARKTKAALAAARAALRDGAACAFCVDEEKRPVWIESPPAHLGAAGLEMFAGRVRGIAARMEHEFEDAVTRAIRKGEDLTLVGPDGLALRVRGADDLALVSWTPPAARASSVIQLPLTPAEKATIDLLAEGLSLEEVAARRGVELSTQRTQVKRLYRKFQVNNLGQLMARVLRAA